jgi:hypothetical protein
MALPVLGGTPANQLTPEETATGWKLLFDGKTTQGWHAFKQTTFPTNKWEVSNGWLHALGKGGGDIVSDGLYDQFELTWDWRIDSGGNSGLKYFVSPTRSSPLGHEYQLLDDERHPDGKLAAGKRLTATFYDVLKTSVKTTVSPPGEVNHSRIVVKGNQVEHWLNGVKVLEYECGSDATKAAVAESKFNKTPDFGKRLKGHLLIQDHNSQVWFQNLKIRDLSK